MGRKKATGPCGKCGSASDWYSRKDGTRACAACARAAQVTRRLKLSAKLRPIGDPEGQAIRLRGDAAGYDEWLCRKTREDAVKPTHAPPRPVDAKPRRVPKWEREVIDRSDN